MRKIKLCVQLKNKRQKKTKNTSMDVVRLLESHTRRTANRFSIRMLFVFGLPLFCNSPRTDALECLVFTIYKGTFNYLNWQHSGVENNFKSVRSIWMTELHCLTFIHKDQELICLAINWFLLQQVKDKSCIYAEVWFTKDPRLLSHGRLWMRRWRMDAGHEDWRHKGTCLTRHPIFVILILIF